MLCNKVYIGILCCAESNWQMSSAYVSKNFSAQLFPLATFTLQAALITQTFQAQFSFYNRLRLHL